MENDIEKLQLQVDILKNCLIKLISFSTNELGFHNADTLISEALKINEHSTIK